MKHQQKGFASVLAVIGVVIILVLIAAAVYYTSVMRKSAPAETPPASPVSLGPIDFSQLLTATVPDLTVESDPQSYTLSNGQYSGVMKVGDGANAAEVPFLFALNTASTSYAYGDIDGDGTRDVAAVLAENTGGTGYFNYLTVFSNKTGAPKLIASIFLGDRVIINKVSVAGKVITVDFITQGPDEPMCCGTLRKTLSFEMSGGKLVEKSK